MMNDLDPTAYKCSFFNPFVESLRWRFKIWNSLWQGATELYVLYYMQCNNVQWYLSIQNPAQSGILYMPNLKQGHNEDSLFITSA